MGRASLNECVREARPHRLRDAPTLPQIAQIASRAFVLTVADSGDLCLCRARTSSSGVAVLSLVLREREPDLDESAANRPGSGCCAIEAGGTMLRRTEPGEELDVRLKMGCGQVVRLDSDRHQRHNQLKLSLLDLPFLPDEVRELAPPGSLPGSPCPRELEP
jgi:hypothetical protein